MSAIDYDLAKIKGFVFDVDGVLSPSTIPMSSEGVPMRMVNIKDGYALQLAVKRGFKIAIISGGNTKAVDVRFRALGIEDIFQGVAHKLPVFEQWLADNNLDASEIAFMGDDIPDLRIMRHIPLSCTPADGAWECRQTARYISRFNGGYGAVRDLVEQVMKAQDLWLADEDAFGW